MFKNDVECTGGVLAFKDTTQSPEKQQDKYYIDEQSFLSSDKTIPSHTSEVLRQVYGSYIPEGRWFVGDTWFGRINIALEF